MKSYDVEVSATRPLAHDQEEYPPRRRIPPGPGAGRMQKGIEFLAGNVSAAERSYASYAFLQEPAGG